MAHDFCLMNRTLQVQQIEVMMMGDSFIIKIPPAVLLIELAHKVTGCFIELQIIFFFL